VNGGSRYPDVLPDQAKIRSEKMNLDAQFMEAAVTPDRFKSNDAEVANLMPFHSAPVTPSHTFHAVSSDNMVSVSAPGTPNRNYPPTVKRVSVSMLEKESVLMAPSAFKTVSSPTASSKGDVGVIGSGIRQPSDKSAYNKFIDQLTQMKITGDRTSPRQLPADPKLAPGNKSHQKVDPLLTLNHLHENNHQKAPPSAQSEQQQLLYAQRMAKIQQAQLHQQKKLQEIAKLGRQANPPQNATIGVYFLSFIVGFCKGLCSYLPNFEPEMMKFA